jgi:hypothetical protein
MINNPVPIKPFHASPKADNARPPRCHARRQQELLPQSALG